MTPADLAAIRERAEQATPGPWIVQRPGREVWQTEPYAPGPALVLQDEHIYEPNAVFIAHAREDIPALLDHIEVQASVIEALNAGVNSALSAKIHAVRELHTSVKPDSDGEHYLDPLTRKPKCGECLLIHPCPTITALDGDPPDPPTPTYLDN